MSMKKNKRRTLLFIGLVVILLSGMWWSYYYAEKRNRKKRGIYIVDTVIYNADAVGAYNILRKYHAVSGKKIDMPVTGLSSTKTIKVAV